MDRPGEVSCFMQGDEWDELYAEQQRLGIRQYIRDLEARLAGCEGFSPTADNVNALPEKMRRYIHDLETRCDPAGDIRELAIARDTCRGLESEVERLEKERDEWQSLCEDAIGTASETTTILQRKQESQKATEEIRAELREKITEGVQAIRKQRDDLSATLERVREWRDEVDRGNMRHVYPRALRALDDILEGDDDE